MRTQKKINSKNSSISKTKLLATTNFQKTESENDILQQNTSGSFILQQFYLNESIPQLKQLFNYKNIHEIPKIEKVVINQTFRDRSNSKGLNNTVNELSKITGQRGVFTRAKKSIAGFQITKSDALGVKITLRRKYMYAFLHRLINLSLPRIRDFRGLNSLSFDGYGNYTFGIQEQLMFPEMNPESLQSSQGLHISIVTTAKTNKEAYFLLKTLGMPFQKNELWEEK